MRALVLGGNRYIGRNLVFELARQGHEVTVVNSHPSPLPDGTLRLHADRQVPGALAEVLSTRRDDFDIIFDNTAYHVRDLQPLVELFGGRVGHFVFTSSAAVYRRSFVQPIAENFPRHRAGSDDPRTAYGVGKIECEDYLLGIGDELPSTVLRVGHTIGPRSPLASREPIYFARLEAGRPIPVPGEGFPFVQLVHIDDVARAMAAVAGNERTHGEVYNINGAELTSIFGCITLMARAVGVQPNIVHVPLDIAKRAASPLVHWGEALVGGAMYSIDRALSDLDWTPQYGLLEAYRDSYAWYASEGRQQYTFDFSSDDSVLAEVARLQ